MSQPSTTASRVGSASPLRASNFLSAHSNAKRDLGRCRGELRFNMHNKHTIIPFDKFMTHFVPKCESLQEEGKVSASSFPNIFKNLRQFTSEQDMYNTLPKTFNKVKSLKPGYSFVATPYKFDKGTTTKESIDCGMYPKGHVPKLPPNSKHKFPAVDWSWVEIPVECKIDPTDQDPFDEDESTAEPLADKRQDALGQILSYAELVFQRQQRMFLFMIIFLGDYVRIIRIDRSGLFATEKFNYKEEGEKLYEFVYRYCLLSKEDRGHDPTATRIHPNSKLGQKMRAKAEPNEADGKRAYVRELFKESLDPKWPWWVLQVPCQQTEEEKAQNSPVRIERFAVGRPHFQAPGVAGRGTRGYVALKLTVEKRSKKDAEDELDYLKDAWRVDHDDIEPEGSVLKELNDAKIRFIPTLVCHGDLPEQVTMSQELWLQYHAGRSTDSCPLKRHQHYRLACKEVGKPLKDFKNAWQLVWAILCCLTAHHEAYSKSGIIHRDVSAGNILLCLNGEGDWVGLLNDWELSKRVSTDNTVPVGRQPDRTGTWQFMSAHALNDRYRAIIVPDELEAFLHVLLYYAVRFLSHNLPDSAVGSFLYRYFDDFVDGKNYFTCGPIKYSSMKDGKIDITSLVSGGLDEKGRQPFQKVILQFNWPDDTEKEHPINTIISTLLTWFSAYYALDDDSAKRPKKPLPAKSLPSLAMSETTSSLLEEMEGKATASSSLPTDSATTNVQQSLPLEVLLTESKKIMTHEAALSLVAKTLRKEVWPDHDKCEDKRPKEGYVIPKDQVAANSVFRTTGSKRGRAEMVGPVPAEVDELEPQTPSKRARSSGRR